MSEIKAVPEASALADAIKNGDGSITDILRYSALEVMEAVKKIAESDSICICEARVICTNATEDSLPHHMKNGEGLIHMGNIEELNRTNIELCENFEGCTEASDGKCLITEKYKEWIADEEWKAVDETSSQGKGKEKLNQETSYMVCTEYGGIIYFHDNGQAIIEFLNNDENFTEWAKTNRVDKIAYIGAYIELAKIEQLRTGIPWQLTLTQMALESGWGSVAPVDIYTGMNSYNLFGIKNLKPVNDNDYVRSWTKEKIEISKLGEWEKEHEKWALEGEKLNVLKDKGNGELEIEVIQPFRCFESFTEGVIYHSEVLLDDRYSEAWEHEDNPFIYLAIIAPIYATGGDYEDTAGKIMDDYFEWDDKKDNWKEYQLWKQNQ